MYNVTINGIELELEAGEGLFSPGTADRGTLAMLSGAEIKPGEKVLDLGCGCGIVGIYAAVLSGAANVTMCDIDPKAVEAARENAARNGVPEVTALCSDGLRGVSGRFSVILSNPPYHTDFSVAKGFIEDGFRALETGGRMYMVTKRLDWYKNKLSSVFGGVKVREEDGYFIFCAEKRLARPVKKEKPKNQMSKKLARKHQNKA